MTTTLARSDDTDITLADREQAAEALAHILATGDLSKLTPTQKVAYYLDTCRSLGINPRTRPFDWLTLKGRLILYPNATLAAQIRRQHQISVEVIRREAVGDLFVVEVRGTTPSGRTDQASKYVPTTVWDAQHGRRRRLPDDELADAYAKAETGAKRRLLMSMIGLGGLPDPEELRGARPVIVDGTGAVLTQPTPEQRELARLGPAAAAAGFATYESTEARSGARSPLAGMPSQAPTEAELQRPAYEPNPDATFKPSDEDVRRWLGAWFAATKSTSLESDDARHRFVEQWTDGRTASLRNFFASATERQAGEILAHVRMLVDEERQAIAASHAESDDDESAEF